MLVDTSVWLAILLREDGHEAYSQKLETCPVVRITAPGYLEATMASVGKIGPLGADRLNALFELADVKVIPFDENAALVAADAFLRYGKGQRHPAQLNFGDCISYAVSKCEVMPLLFKGDDFRHTDVECAL